MGRRESARDEVLRHYGGRCIYCGEGRPIFLTIDHIAGAGNQHRRAEQRAKEIYTWLRVNGFPDGYQVACWNCNCAKSRVGVEELLRVLFCK